MSPIAVPDGDGTQNLQPLGVAGQVVHLGLGAAETGNTAKALTSVSGRAGNPAPLSGDREGQFRHAGIGGADLGGIGQRARSELGYWYVSGIADPAPDFLFPVYPANGVMVAAPVLRAITAHELQGLLSAHGRFAARRN